MNEARLEQTEHGLVPAEEGWFVLNTRESVWQENAEFGRYTRWEGKDDAAFKQVGINISVLRAGQPMCMYHGEDTQEDFLVLAGEGVLIVEGEERPLAAWDFVHCPAWAKHVIVATGPDPFIVLAMGARPSTGVVYPVEPVAQKYGAGVEQETSEPREAYASMSPVLPKRYVEGDLPDV